MQPLINQFTKNLKPCSGCGSNDAVYETWAEAKEKGEKMTFVFEVVVEAETYKQAVGKFPDDFEILKGTTKTDVKSGIQTGAQFQRTSTQSLPVSQ